MDAETLLLKARADLMFGSDNNDVGAALCFFGTLAVRMPMIEVKNPAFCQTMATDGRNLYWYRPFVEEIATARDRSQLLFVLAHEIMHVCFEHPIRRQHRDPKLFNIACDYAINGELVETRVGTMPEGGLLDARFTGMGAEEIYAILEQEQPPQQSSGGSQNEGGNDGGQQQGGDGMSQPSHDPARCGGVIDACPQHDKAAIAQARAEIQTAVRQAAAIAKAQAAGTLPAGLSRLIDRLTAPVIDWRAVLRRFIDESMRTDFSWSRPNRRFAASGYYAPGMVPDGIHHLVVAIDTSGSISDDDLVAFASEVNGAFGDGGIDKVTVIYADAAVAHVDVFESGDKLRFEMHGGGGTAFDDTFRWIADNAGDASAIIYFTDMMTSDWGEEPAAPTMWVVRGSTPHFEQWGSQAPFGESIHLQAA